MLYEKLFLQEKENVLDGDILSGWSSNKQEHRKKIREQVIEIQNERVFRYFSTKKYLWKTTPSFTGKLREKNDESKDSDTPQTVDQMQKKHMG